MMTKELIARLRHMADLGPLSNEGRQTLREAADALEGGVTVTDEMIEKAHDAFHAFPRPGYWKDKMRAALQAALSAPAQRVEEGTRDTVDAIVDALFVDLRDRRFLKWLFSKRPTFIANFEDGSPLESLDEDVQREIHETWKGIIASTIAASPAPAPHAGVDAEGIDPKRWRPVMQELVDAMRRYEVDVEADAPQKHRDMMDRADRLLAASPVDAEEAETKLMHFLVREVGGHGVTIVREGERLIGWSAGPKGQCVAMRDLRAALEDRT